MDKVTPRFAEMADDASEDLRTEHVRKQITRQVQVSTRAPRNFLLILAA